MIPEKKKNFERELPEGYRQGAYVNAKDAKLGIIFNLIALAVCIAVMGVALISLALTGRLSIDIISIDASEIFVAYFLFILLMLGYIVLHEIVHGIAYKALTGEKLTFGISWSCAFCGVPHIFTYKKTAVISTASPLTLFTLIFIPLLAVLYFVSPLYYLIFSFVFGLHLGGCSGDIYILYLLLARFKGKKLLMRDTGPEQFIYLPIEKEKV